MLVVGYYAGLGKIINYALGRPCYVIVFNPDDSNYQAKLGRETLPLIANAQVTFQDIYVAATKKGKLTISSEQAPDQIVYNIAVPLSPGLDVAVNPNGKIEFGVYDFRGMTDKSLDAKARQTLISDIVRLRPRIYSSIVLGRLKNMAEEHVQGKKTDPLFTSQQYNFNRMSLSRSIDYTERRKDKKEKPEVFRPTLVKLTDVLSIQRLVCRIQPCPTRSYHGPGLRQYARTKYIYKEQIYRLPPPGRLDIGGRQENHR